MVGKCTLERCKVVASMSGSSVDLIKDEVSYSSLSHATPEMSSKFISLLSKMLLQFDYKSLDIRKKYIPKPNERVSFRSDSVYGYGVVRNTIQESGSVEMYCYYIPESDECGFSMHEKDTVNVFDFSFSPMTIVEMRKLDYKLSEYGKRWNEKLHRVEPKIIQAETEKPYWFMDDEMKVMKSTEKCTPTSRFRINSGNYFSTEKECVKYAGMFSDLLRDRLASVECV